MIDKKIDKTVVRNAAYKRGGLNKRERHNERKNINYQNDDIRPERTAYNIHFKRCEETGDDKKSGYEKTFDKLIADGVISTHGLGKDPNIIDELIFDVNTSYFDKHGGYEYAKVFYEEAYRLAVELIGGEQYVLSAVMHADERNSDISGKLGRDVYHYHLHVVYIPVVQKELRFSKDNKNPELRGKLKEVITQVSHSKKWPRVKKVDENGEIVKTQNGKAVLVNSYSLLQDRFFEHMRAAGYRDIERGERGSTAEHLSVLEYKLQQDKKHNAELSNKITAKEKQVAQLDKTIEGLEKKIKANKQIAVDIDAIDKMAHTAGIFQNKIQLSPDCWKKVSGLAKEGIYSRTIIADLKKQFADVQKKLDKAKSRQGKITDYLRIFQETSAYRKAVALYPNEVNAFINDIVQRKLSREEFECGTGYYVNRGEVI